jgi:hypothetical protein
MTEADWLACDVPRTMLRFLRGRTSERKFRLFACACWRCRCRNMPSLKDVVAIVAKAEKLADGEYQTQKGDGGWLQLQKNAFNVATLTSKTVAGIRSKGGVPPGEQVELLRDVFGNPFRPVALDPAWLTSDVLLLARGIYDDRAFDRMPILADALQDAGCDNGDVLTHCRDTNLVHVRGCWVVDLLLGKS